MQFCIKFSTNTEEMQEGGKMEKEYIVTVTLKDGTKIKSQRDYNWGYADELNDTRKQFVDINGNTFNKESIITVITEKNPKYEEEEKQEDE